ncbi:MAG: esterase family protein [SAR324 cluster bacterium]|nr:esterase family protein [SAR324 cluster bacterium]
MQKKHELIYSPALGYELHVWCYGHWGVPLLVFPSAAGMAHEWEENGMVASLSPLIDSGKIKLYCPENNVSQSWTNRHEHPADRVKRHQDYENFILTNLLPWIYADCQSEKLSLFTAGCSLGAYYAANFALKNPDHFQYALCMSGRYQITQFTDGFSNSDIYFNNPIDYVANLDGSALEHVQKNTHLTLVCGQGAYEEGCIEETQKLGEIFRQKGISHQLDIWGYDVSHDWYWWRRQAVHHLSQLQD